VYIVEQKCVLASASKRLHLAAKEVSRHYVFYILNLIATRLDQKTSYRLLSHASKQTSLSHCGLEIWLQKDEKIQVVTIFTTLQHY